MAQNGAAEKGYDPVFGARPLKRFLQRYLETRLARALIAGEVYPPEAAQRFMRLRRATRVHPSGRVSEDSTITFKVIESADICRKRPESV